MADKSKFRKCDFNLENLNFSDLLRTDSANGKVFFNNRRSILLACDAMGILRQQLVNMLGEELAFGLLFRFGYSHGFSDAADLEGQYPWDSEKEWLSAGPLLHTLSGVVQVEPQLIEFDKAAGRLNMEVVWRNSYEAEQHRNCFGLCSHPVCWTLTGYASGYASRFMGSEMLAVESECVGKGDPQCRAVLRPSKEWGKDAERYKDALKLVDISHQLNELRTMLAAQEALRESQEKFHSITAAALDGIIILDRNWKITYCNEAVAKSFLYDASVLHGLDGRKLFVPDSIIDEYVERAEQSRFFGDPKAIGRSLEISAVRSDGSQFPVDVAFSQVRLSGDWNTVAILHDITDRKKREKQLFALQDQLRESQKMESIGRLAGGVAHDFNNLLTAIRGYCYLCLEDLDTNSPLRQRISAIDTAGERASILTQQLLALSRRQLIELREVNLNKSIVNLVEMLERVLRDDITLVTELDDSLGFIRADGAQIDQVILNLVVNARDAMPYGGVIKISTSNIEIPAGDAHGWSGMFEGPHVLLEVSDRGTGMTTQVMEQIFEPFFTTKEKGRGTGLGLSVVHGIVTQCFGAIKVASELGEGSNFQIVFPTLDSPGVAAPLGRVEEQEPLLKGHETIFVVEDDADARSVTKAMLQRTGYRVISASRGEDAISLLGSVKERIDLLLTDVFMPGMSGIEVADVFLRRVPGVKVIYCSGYTDDEALCRGVQEGALDFIQKPFTFRTLLMKVREVLDRDISKTEMMPI